MIPRILPLRKTRQICELGFLLGHGRSHSLWCVLSGLNVGLRQGVNGMISEFTDLGLEHRPDFETKSASRYRIFLSSESDSHVPGGRVIETLLDGMVSRICFTNYERTGKEKLTCESITHVSSTSLSTSQPRGSCWRSPWRQRWPPLALPLYLQVQPDL